MRVNWPPTYHHHRIRCCFINICRGISLDGINSVATLLRPLTHRLSLLEEAYLSLALLNHRRAFYTRVWCLFCSFWVCSYCFYFCVVFWYFVWYYVFWSFRRMKKGFSRTSFIYYKNILSYSIFSFRVYLIQLCTHRIINRCRFYFRCKRA